VIRILVTGANGQLGKSIQKIATNYPNFYFVFKSSQQFDITDTSSIRSIFSSSTFDYCINCAAYTNVEQAEKDSETAFMVNAEAVKKLAMACRDKGIVLFHFSTDYVFNGKKKTPYETTDVPDPINVYGASKYKGEGYIQETCKKYFIVRTSWVYSEFGKNFYKTILDKAKSEKVLYVTDQQTGCPTHAKNLATYTLDLIESGSKNHGIRHFTDGAAMTWYGFAKKILNETGLAETVKIEKAKNYRTFAQRPKNSVLATNTSNL